MSRQNFQTRKTQDDESIWTEVENFKKWVGYKIWND